MENLNEKNLQSVLLLVVVLGILWYLYGCDCGSDCSCISWLICDCAKPSAAPVTTESDNGANSTSAKSSEPMATPENTDSAPTLYYHYTTWCGYCKKMRPLWDEVKSEMSGKAFFIEVDEDVAHTPSITSYPTVVAHVNGKKVTYSGGYTKSELKKFAQQAVDMKNGMKRR